MVYELELPPLRDRDGDIDLLVRQFLEKHERSSGKQIEVSPETTALLRCYSWPGNVRELENVIHRAVVSAGSQVVEPLHLPNRIRQERSSPTPPRSPLQTSHEGAPGATDAPSPPPEAATPSLNLEQLEAITIRNALERARGNLAGVTRVLGISRATLYRKLKKYKIPNPPPGQRSYRRITP